MEMKEFLQDISYKKHLESVLNCLCLRTHNKNSLTSTDIISYKKKISSIDIKISVEEENVILSSPFPIGQSFIKELTESYDDNISINIDNFFEVICIYLISGKYDFIDIEHLLTIINDSYYPRAIISNLKHLLIEEENAKLFAKVLANSIYESYDKVYDKPNDLPLIYDDIENSIDMLLDLISYDDNSIGNNITSLVKDFIRIKCTCNRNYKYSYEYCKFYYLCVTNDLYEQAGVLRCQIKDKVNLSSLWNLQNLNFVKYTEAYIPSFGKADTIIGEIARAFQYIVYRILNDGDCPVYNSPSNLSLYNLCQLLNQYCYNECEEYMSLEKFDINEMLKGIDIDSSLIHSSFDNAINSNYLHRIDLREGVNLSDACDGIKDSTSGIIAIQLASFFYWLFINHKDKIDELIKTKNYRDSRIGIFD